MRPEGFQRATADIRLFSCPLVASAEAKFPAFRKKQLCLKDQPFGRAHLARHSINSRKSSLGALLRKREVTGRDASLPAPLLAASLKLNARGTVGALPQTPQGTLSLDPARGNFPLDPFARLSWSRFHAASACCFFLFYSSMGAPNTSTFGSIVATCRSRSLSVVYRFMMWSFSTICRIISSLPTSTTSFLARVKAV